MNQFVTIDTPGGCIWVEVEELDKTQIPELASSHEMSIKSFHDTVQALKTNAASIIKSLGDLGPKEVEVQFGIKAGVEAGTPFFGLAKASGEASYTVSIKWTSEKK